MKSETMLRKGWCPGVLQPMRAKDGLLVRLKISCGVVPAATMRAIARTGRDHGNELFDLSARANLQMRGVREERLPHLIEALGGLGLIDATAAAEAVRNVLVSPLAGLSGRGNAHAAAKALEAALAANRDLHALPPKFSFLIDDGCALSLAGIPADVRFCWIGGEKPFSIEIGGAANEASFLGRCKESDIPGFATRIALAFLKLSSQLPEPPRRMRALIARCGGGAIAALAGLRLYPVRRPRVTIVPCPIGFLRLTAANCFGAGATFGRLDADMLDAAANASEIFGSCEIRLTPWRAFIFPHVQKQRVNAMREYFAAHGFIVDPKDARLAVAACGGSSTCERSTTDTRSDALALMFAARSLHETGLALHVFGCAKSCGRQADAPLTLTAHAGLYDLVADERAFGVKIGSAGQLTLAAAREKLERIARRAGRQSELDWP
jgi:precorrin-3B synthase